jgi:hypothetical protein
VRDSIHPGSQATPLIEMRKAPPQFEVNVLD